MRIVRIVHDLVAAFLLGGIATASAAAMILFARAPSREVAGQIGQTIFEVVGRGAFVFSLVLLACRVAMSRAEPAPARGSLALGLAVLIVVLAGAIALWLTPAMGEIWRDGVHAADGSGLAGADREAFMSRHAIGSAFYFVIILASAVIIGLRSAGRA